MVNQYLECTIELCTNRFKMVNQHYLGSKRGLQREGMIELCLKGKGTGVFQADRKGPWHALNGLHKAMLGGTARLKGTYLHLNILRVDHFHNAHHIVKHQAKLLTVVQEKNTPLNIHIIFTQATYHGNYGAVVLPYRL